MPTPKYKNSRSRGHEIENFGGTLLAHQLLQPKFVWSILRFREFFLIKINHLKSLHEQYGNALSLNLLPQCSKYLQLLQTLPWS